MKPISYNVGSVILKILFKNTINEIIIELELGLQNDQLASIDYRTYDLISSSGFAHLCTIRFIGS